MRMSIEEYKNLGKKKNKFHAVTCEMDGITFGSMDERELYKLLKSDAATHHIDCHVPVTLPGGLRLNIDFIVWKWRQDQYNALGLKPEAIEYKGKETNEFKRMRKLFDSSHPLAPMTVFTKKGNKWITI